MNFDCGCINFDIGFMNLDRDNLINGHKVENTRRCIEYDSQQNRYKIG
jgi:hypothetical protein